MTLIIPPGHAQFVATWASASFATGGAATTFGLGEDLGPEPVPLAAAAELVGDLIISQFGTLMDNSVTLVTMSAFSETERADVPVGYTFSRSTPSPPPNVTVVVRKSTARRGRRGQGRMFWPSLLGEEDVDERGTISNGRLTVLQGAFDNLLSGVLSTTGSPMVLLQNEEGVTPPISPPPLVTDLQVQTLAATQRRRLRR